MKNVLALMRFELQKTSVTHTLWFLFVFTGLSFFLAGMFHEFGHVLPLDFLIVLSVCLWSSTFSFAGKGFFFTDLGDRMSSPFYTYMKRFPISESELFVSRALMKLVVGTVLVGGMFTAALIVSQNAPFQFGSFSYVAWILLWISFSHISIMNANGEIGYSHRERPALFREGMWWNFSFLVFYALVQLLLFVTTGSTMSIFSMTVNVSSYYPMVAVGIALFISGTAICWSLVHGTRKLKRRETQ